MKDTLMTVAFPKGELKVWHSSMMGNLADVFAIGNAYRLEEGKHNLPMSAWIQRQDVVEYIAYLTNKLGKPAIERRKGKGGGTYAHLKIMVDAASQLSPQFKDEVYDTFIQQRILAHRDESGENFKDMNSLLALHAIEVLGKPAHNGHFINLAKIIKTKVGVDDWNTASAYQLHKRNDIEQRIGDFLRLGVVRDWEHLKDLANRA